MALKHAKTPDFHPKRAIIQPLRVCFLSPIRPPIPRRRVREPQATVISQAGQRHLLAPGRGDQIILRPVRFAPLGLTVCSPRTETAEWGTPLGLNFSKMTALLLFKRQFCEFQ